MRWRLGLRLPSATCSTHVVSTTAPANTDLIHLIIKGNSSSAMDEEDHAYILGHKVRLRSQGCM